MSILPDQPFPQLKTHERAAFQHFPLFGGAFYYIEILVILQRRGINQPRHFRRSRIRGKIRNEIGRLAYAPHQYVSAVFRLRRGKIFFFPRRAKTRAGRHTHEKRCDKPQRRKNQRGFSCFNMRSYGKNIPEILRKT